MAKNATVGSHWTFLSSVGLASGPGIDEAWLVRPSAPRLRREDGLIAPSYRPLHGGPHDAGRLDGPTLARVDSSTRGVDSSIPLDGD